MPGWESTRIVNVGGTSESETPGVKRQESKSTGSHESPWAFEFIYDLFIPHTFTCSYGLGATQLRGEQNHVTTLQQFAIKEQGQASKGVIIKSRS